LTQDAINVCADVVQRASDRDLEAAVTADGARILELVLAGMRASYVGAPEIEAEILWTLSTGGRTWTRFVTRLSEGDCTIFDRTADEELRDSPRLRIAMEGVTFLRLVTGGAGPLKLFATGQLKAHGDLALAAQLARLFRFPDSPASRRAPWRRPRAKSGLDPDEGQATASAGSAAAPGWFGRRRT
jgi:hypothetical protein